MSARILEYALGLFSLLREIQYTTNQCANEPLADAYLAIFQAHRAEWQSILLEEIAILDKVIQAQAVVDKADQALNQFTGRVSHVVDEYSDGPTRKQLRTSLFKNKALSKFRRPVLGGQLHDMRDWNAVLSQSSIGALSALAPEAERLVVAGYAAAEERDAAQLANRHFRDVGPRKQFIDKLNATRKEMHGALAKLPFQRPDLPSDFADGFFASGPTREEEDTIDGVKATIEDLQRQLAEQTALLQKLEEEAANAARDEHERRARIDEADDLETKAKEMLAKAAALKAANKK
ncbi:MAG TPA: hypothetical protein PK156_37755 [Polyangium sp.]|nr:hypothetical protein [Polyangium sp.]